MAISQKDIKLLWGRAASRCAICKHELTEDTKSVSKSFLIGQMAHIVAQSLDGPRGSSPLDAAARDEYSNLILLCPTDHTRIDSNVSDYTVEVLHKIKTDHEEWVKDNLIFGENITEDDYYHFIIENTENILGLYNWEAWSARIGDPIPSIRNLNLDSFHEYRHFIFRAIWPDSNIEFQNVVKYLSIILWELYEEFGKHPEVISNSITRVEQFYHISEWNPKLYKDLANEFDQIIDNIDNISIIICKTLNLYSEIIRRDFNKKYRISKGKYALESGPYSDLKMHTRIFEFDENDKRNILENGGLEQR